MTQERLFCQWGLNQWQDNALVVALSQYLFDMHDCIIIHPSLDPHSTTDTEFIHLWLQPINFVQLRNTTDGIISMCNVLVLLLLFSTHEIVKVMFSVTSFRRALIKDPGIIHCGWNQASVEIHLLRLLMHTYTYIHTYAEIGSANFSRFHDWTDSFDFDLKLEREIYVLVCLDTLNDVLSWKSSSSSNPSHEYLSLTNLPC